jgi:hypothetical protein
MNSSNSHPIARLIAAANISPTVFAIVAESIANEARHIRAFGDGTFLWMTDTEIGHPAESHFPKIQSVLVRMSARMLEFFQPHA